MKFRKTTELIIRLITDIVNTIKKIVRQILLKLLNMRQLCTIMILKNSHFLRKIFSQLNDYLVVISITRNIPQICGIYVMDPATGERASSLTVKQISRYIRIPEHKHPLYSPDFAPCTLCLLPKVKSSLKGIYSQCMKRFKQISGKNVCSDGVEGDKCQLLFCLQ